MLWCVQGLQIGGKSWALRVDLSCADALTRTEWDRDAMRSGEKNMNLLWLKTVTHFPLVLAWIQFEVTRKTDQTANPFYSLFWKWSCPLSLEKVFLCPKVCVCAGAQKHALMHTLTCTHLGLYTHIRHNPLQICRPVYRASLFVTKRSVHDLVQSGSEDHELATHCACQTNV